MPILQAKATISGNKRRNEQWFAVAKALLEAVTGKRRRRHATLLLFAAAAAAALSAERWRDPPIAPSPSDAPHPPGFFSRVKKHYRCTRIVEFLVRFQRLIRTAATKAMLKMALSSSSSSPSLSSPLSVASLEKSDATALRKKNPKKKRRSSLRRRKCSLLHTVPEEEEEGDERKQRVRDGTQSMYTVQKVNAFTTRNSKLYTHTQTQTRAKHAATSVEEFDRSTFKATKRNNSQDAHQEEAEKIMSSSSSRSSTTPLYLPSETTTVPKCTPMAITTGKENSYTKHAYKQRRETEDEKKQEENLSHLSVRPCSPQKHQQLLLKRQEVTVPPKTTIHLPSKTMNMYTATIDHYVLHTERSYQQDEEKKEEENPFSSSA